MFKSMTTFVRTVSLLGAVLICGCGRQTDADFEQRVRESRSELLHCVGFVEQKVMENRKKAITNDICAIVNSFFRVYPNYKLGLGDCYYVCTNESYWGFRFYEEPMREKVVIGKRIVSKVLKSRVLYLGVTCNADRVESTNLWSDLFSCQVTE